MNGSVYALALLALAMAAFTAWRMPDRFGEALRQAWTQAYPILASIPLALLAATWASSLIPPEIVAAAIGADRGMTGILIASLLGSLLPGGPMVAFPVALVIWKMGAGSPQMVALLTSWAIFALHRTFAFELPIMGTRFVIVKFAVTWMMPPASGVLAAGILVLWR